MNKLWKWTLAAVVAGGLTLAAQAPSAAPVAGQTAEQASMAYEYALQSLRVDPDGSGGPTVTLDTDGVVDFESFVLDGPDRLVLDLRGAVSRLEGYRFPVANGGVVQVRAGQHVLEPVPVTRVVFDLDHPVPYTIEEDGDQLHVHFGDRPVAHSAPPAPGAIAVSKAVEPETIEAEPVARPAVERTAVEPQPAEPDAIEVAAGPESVTPEPAEPVDEDDSRSVEPVEIERLLSGPSLAAPAEEPAEAGAVSKMFESQKIGSAGAVYTGKRISLNLVDADIKQVFRLFHEISGLNFVLDAGVTGRVTIVLDQVPWDQALDLILKNNSLDKVLENNVLRIAPTQKLAQEAAARKQLKEAEELEVELVTITRTMSYANAKEVQEMLSGRQSGGSGRGQSTGVLSQRGTVLVDERTNTLIITDVPKRIDAIDQLIDTVDSETPQVMIEARIVETSRNYSQDLGVTWGFTANADASRGTSTGLSFPHNASSRYGLNLPGQEASTLGFSLGNVVDSFTLDLALNALETEGEGRILSAPKVATQNNERAEIEQGVRIPIVNTTATEINVEFVSASLRLVVTPQITAEGTVALDIIVENNSPDFVNTAGDIPSIRTQRAQTRVLINDGGTTVIGGIFTVNEGQSEIGVPWFRKIPGFGWLFRNRQIQNENRELLIFITPKIVKLG